MMKLYSLQDSLQFKEYMDVLKEEHISCYSKESESGEYLKIPSDFSSCGTDLYIDDENQKKAKTLLKNLRQRWDLEEMQSGWKEDEEIQQAEKTEDSRKKSGLTALKTICILFVCGVLLFGIWMML